MRLLRRPCGPPRNDGFMRLLVFGLTACVLLGGCSQTWRHKFVRKRKNPPPPPQAVLALEPDHKAIHPAAVRYREHYAFWKSWHSELLDSLGDSRKRDLRYLGGTLGEAQALQALLTGDAAERMRRVVLELRRVSDRWRRAPAPWSVSTADRLALERLHREIGKSFHYAKVKSSILREPDREEETPVAAAAGGP